MYVRAVENFNYALRAFLDFLHQANHSPNILPRVFVAIFEAILSISGLFMLTETVKVWCGDSKDEQLTMIMLAEVKLIVGCCIQCYLVPRMMLYHVLNLSYLFAVHNVMFIDVKRSTMTGFTHAMDYQDVRSKDILSTIWETACKLTANFFHVAECYAKAINLKHSLNFSEQIDFSPTFGRIVGEHFGILPFISEQIAFSPTFGRIVGEHCRIVCEHCRIVCEHFGILPFIKPLYYMINPTPTLTPDPSTNSSQSRSDNSTIYSSTQTDTEIQSQAADPIP